mmetsp:Transcript_45391/g.95262  ORF Transcript_45391/g.95262 Transcript_45391/m.95262 type:complete len:114 (-) Transcript_45391:229-570(-)
MGIYEEIGENSPINTARHLSILFFFISASSAVREEWNDVAKDELLIRVPPEAYRGRLGAEDNKGWLWWSSFCWGFHFRHPSGSHSLLMEPRCLFYWYLLQKQLPGTFELLKTL